MIIKPLSRLTYILCRYLNKNDLTLLIKNKGVFMSENPELESIDRQIVSENDRHRQRIEQLRRQKQQIKNTQARKKDNEKIQKTYKECINELNNILKIRKNYACVQDIF